MGYAASSRAGGSVRCGHKMPGEACVRTLEYGKSQTSEPGPSRGSSDPGAVFPIVVAMIHGQPIDRGWTWRHNHTGHHQEWSLLNSLLAWLTEQLPLKLHSQMSTNRERGGERPKDTRWSCCGKTIKQGGRGRSGGVHADGGRRRLESWRPAGGGQERHLRAVLVAASPRPVPRATSPHLIIFGV